MRNFEYLCRICAKLKCEESQNLFNQQTPHKLLQYIEQLTNMRLKDSQNLPQHICTQCLKNLKQAKDFRKCCIKAQMYYMSPEYNKSVKQASERQNELYLRRNYRLDAESRPGSLADSESEAEVVILTENKMKQTDTESYKKSKLNSTLKKKDCSAMEPEVDFVNIEILSSFAEDDNLIKINCAAEDIMNSDAEEQTSLSEIVELSGDNKIPSEITITQNANDDNKETNNNTARRETVRFICEICGNNSNNVNQFKTHMDRHNGVKPYECQLCSKRFVTRSELKRHNFQHKGEYYLNCRYCDKVFNHYGARHKHERIHLNIRPYKCNFCEKSFLDNNSLKAHVVKHTGERNYPCEVCDKSFGHPKFLGQHRRSKYHKENVEKHQNMNEDIEYLNAFE